MTFRCHYVFFVLTLTLVCCTLKEDMEYLVILHLRAKVIIMGWVRLTNRLVWDCCTKLRTV